MEQIIRLTKPLIADLFLEEGKLFLCNPRFYGREEAKNFRYVGEAKFQFGRGISYVHAEERARLSNSNAILSMQTTDLSSGKIFSFHDKREGIPEWNPNAIYFERAGYYFIDPEQVTRYFRQWNDFRRMRRN
ncbi:hypothetical protein HY449_01880 [Candidatus Pacearchaeota archaeon]|nr:hypothetical protein [Candidatus Pacearchaeota archaeon]